MNNIIEKAISDGISYREYRNMIDTLLQRRETTGAEQSEKRVGYTEVGVARMNRLDRTMKLLEEVREMISSINKPQIWLAITEAWCADSAWILPVINQMSEVNSLITLKHVLRDENEELMNLFLTNGGRAIPTILIIDEMSNQVIGRWGPRPAELQRRGAERREDPNPMPYSEFFAALQKWYAADRTETIQKEFAAAVKEAMLKLQEGEISKSS